MRNLLKSTLIVFISGMASAVLFRLLFFIFFRTPVQDEYWWSSLAFLHGLRFDFSSLCALNLIFVLLIYFRKIRTNLVFLNIWIVVNFLYSGLLVGDFIHYSIYNTRLTWDVLGLFHGMNFKVVFLMVSQFLIVIPILTVCFLFSRILILRLFADNKSEFKLIYYPAYFVLVALICVIGYRGGFQRRSFQHNTLGCTRMEILFLQR